MKEPKNETFLAAEIGKVSVNPNNAARIAFQLCEIGRRYKRTAEKLCGGEEVWGRWSESVSGAQEKAYARNAQLIVTARNIVQGLPVTIEQGDLILRAVTRFPNKTTATTALL